MGPLRDVRIVEVGGIGPAPMAAMLLAELGATVLRLDRPQAPDPGFEKPWRYDLLLRSRPAISIDLKSDGGSEFVRNIVQRADILIEGFRPGVMERLGIGPEICLQQNPKLVYGRMTGWGQDGPLAQTAGHDINYIALSGALDAVGRINSPPTPPLNLVGDFGGGALYLVMGLLSALTYARSAGRGQVVDAAMVDGAASLMTLFYGLQAAGLHTRERGANVLDSGAPYYDVYQCSDGLYVAVGAIELKFREELLRKLGLPGTLPNGEDPATWPALRAALADKFRSKTRDEWGEVFANSDACVSPVLSMAEVHGHSHNVSRGTFEEIDGVMQPAPAPRFGLTKLDRSQAPKPIDSDVFGALRPWGFDKGEVDALMQAGTIGLTKMDRAMQ